MDLVGTVNRLQQAPLHCSANRDGRHVETSFINVHFMSTVNVNDGLVGTVDPL